MRARSSLLLVLLALAACAGPGRLADRPASRPVWLVDLDLRGEPADFPLSGRREVTIVYSLVNLSRQAQRLDFPTAQRLEVTLRDSDRRVLFQWSEDRHFAALASSVMVNPGERLEYEAALPTRDMVAGRTYQAEAVLPGYPETVASIDLRPR